MKTPKFLKSLTQAFKISDAGSWLGNILDSVVKYYTHSGMTGESKETMDYENNLFQQNWDERTGPRAQLNDTALAYDDIGLNRMLMAGNQPGATSSSPSPSSSSADPLGTILATIMQGKQMQMNYDIQSYHNETERLNAQTAKFRAQTEAFLTREKWIAERTRNKYLAGKEEASLQGMLLSNSKTAEERWQIRANIQLIEANTEYQHLLTKYAPRLLESQIKEKESLSVLNYARAREVEILTIKHSHDIAQIDALRDKLYYEATLVLTQDRLTEQQISESEARVAKINEEIREIGSRIGLNEADLQYYDWNHPRNVGAPFGVKFGISRPSLQGFSPRP